MRHLVPACVALAAWSATAVHADITNFRSWLDVNPTTPNSTSNAWYGTRGVNGAMMNSNGSYWDSPGFPASTPLIALRTSVGSDNGAAGPATFAGSWVHPGSGIDAVLTFAPSVPTLLGRVSVRSELIANGLSGNGVTISVYTTIAGNTTAHGSVLLAGTSLGRLDDFDFPLTTFQPGDRVHIAFGDNGSYLFDHVNFDATVSVPAPGVIGMAGFAALVVGRRRTRR